jgi:urea carboxylase
LAERICGAWLHHSDVDGATLPVREVRLPIAFDDPSVHDAMRRYQERVRPDAPWCPDNVEFIRRINGLDARTDVFELVRAATYLVVGLGDVYLGAPVAVPLDPRHRLVTTKYEPPRTWTPANAVGIGGVYLCVYGMEGPGGYQLIGRTVPVWRTPGPDGPGPAAPDTGAEPPWLLRHFDMLRFEPVGRAELIRLRAEVTAGAPLWTRPAQLTAADLRGAATAAPETVTFTRRRQAAFAAERSRWAQAAEVAP